MTTSISPVVENIAENSIDTESTLFKSYTRDQYQILSFFASGIGFLADAYDFFVIDSVFDIIKNTSALTPNNTSQNIVITATLIGAVIGQIGFGLGADMLGRRKMFLFTSALVTIGSLGSALVGFGYQNKTHTFTIYHQLMIFRFILGVGIGGEYPLSAAVSSESLEKNDNRLSTFDTTQSLQENVKNNFLWFVTQKPNSLAAVFSLQGLGLLLSSLVILFFLALHFPLESTWRLCLGLGAVPSIIAFYLRWKMHESKTFKNAARRFQQDRDSCTTGDSSESDLSNFKKIATMQSIEDTNQIDKTKIEAHTKNPFNTNQQVVSCHYSVELQKSRDPPTQVPSLSTLMCRKHWRKSGKLLYLFRYALLGSCLSWFLIDVTLYGVASYKTDLSKMILEPKVTDMEMSGKSFHKTPVIAGPSQQHPEKINTNYPPLSNSQVETIRQNVMERTEVGFLFTLLGLPGYLASVFFIHKTGLKNLQLFGFYGIAFVFFSMSVVHFCHVNQLALNIVLLGLTFFFSNFGPNTTTYILPTQLYPTIIRATCHGFSAAMGKVGAVAGTILVKTIETHFGLPWLFVFCSAVSLTGSLVTHFLVKSDDEAKEQQLRMENEIRRHKVVNETFNNV